MRFRELTSEKNLMLAWNRINTSTQARYKNFLRPVINSYGIAVEKNISDLSKKLRSDEFIPKAPLVAYYAKPSGLQRPFTYLGIEDQIVYQAFANKVITKLLPHRIYLDEKNLFSHLLTSDSEVFYLENWEIGFGKLKNRVSDLFDIGNHWVATFDIASFYDSIDHEILIRFLFPRSRNSIGATLFSECLKTWRKGSFQQSDGIPQGPTASSSMAEAFLNSIDRTMAKHYNYLRYSDDIYLMGRTEGEVRGAAVHLDVLCKEKGLIPQTSKFRVKKFRSFNEIEKTFPNMETYHDISSKSISKKSDGIALVIQSRKKNRIEITNRTQFRYGLFRAKKDRNLLNQLIPFISRYPEHIDAIKFYSDQFNTSKPLTKEAKNLILNRYPYDFVVGELWKIVARLGTRGDYIDLKNYAIETIKSTGKGEYKKVGAAIFLVEAEKRGFGKMSKWATYLDSISLSMVMPFLDVSKKGGRSLASEALSRSTPDPAIALLYPIIYYRFTLTDFISNVTKLHSVTQNVYYEVGQISKTTGYNPNPIASQLEQLHSIKKWSGWLNLLGKDYPYALSLLRLAKGVIEINPSSWVTHINSFSDLIIRNFWERVNPQLAARRRVKLIDSSGVHIDYGVLLNNARFARVLPISAANLKIINDKRNIVPPAHPLNKHSGKRNEVLSRKEQRRMEVLFRDSIVEIVDVYSNNYR